MDRRPPIRPAPTKDRSGFSIVELLVVVSVIAILATIAIPRFGGVRDRSLDAAAKSDVRNAIAAQEQRFADVGSYAAFTTEPGGSVDDPPFRASAGVVVTATLPGSSALRIVASHQGTPTSWCASSTSGGVVEGDDC